MKQFFIIFAFVAMLIPAWGQRAEGSADSLKLHDIALQRAKAEKGGSFVFANMWECPLTLSNDYMEITNGNLNVGYGYFFADRFALTACYSAKNFADGFFGSDGFSFDMLSEQGLTLGVRGYLFRRAGFYAEVGVRLGHVHRLSGGVSGVTRYSYIRPAFSFGYEYLITHGFPAFCNRLGVTASFNGIIPLLRDAERGFAEMPYLSGPYIGFVYHF
ncbi:MAG: hypothetical protein MJZ45_02660 [Bacteroidales bacterium]|nr:hypothetical protein [Bacteroidales bacterium]